MLRCFSVCRPKTWRRKGKFDDADADEELWLPEEAPSSRNNKSASHQEALVTIPQNRHQRQDEEEPQTDNRRLMVKLAKQLQKTREQNKKLRRDLQLVPKLRQQVSDAHRLVRAILMPFKSERNSQQDSYMLALQHVAMLRLQLAKQQKRDNDHHGKQTTAPSSVGSKRESSMSASHPLLLMEKRNRELERQNRHLQHQVRQMSPRNDSPLQEITIHFDQQQQQHPAIVYADDPSAGSEGASYYTPNGSLADGAVSASSGVDQYYDADFASVISDAFA